MKVGVSAGFQIIDMFNIIDDNSLSLDEKKQKLQEYQSKLQTPEYGIMINGREGPDVKNGYYIFSNIDEIDYEKLVSIKKYFDEFITCITCEAEMKMKTIVSGYDKKNGSLQYNFELCDKIYNYATRHGKDVRGHTLVWHQHVPEALDMYIEDRLGCTMEEFKAEHPEEFYQKRKYLTEQFLTEYIQTIGKHYPNCYSWDVLNEIVPDMEVSDPQNEYCPTEDERTDGLRHSKWFEYLGKDFYIDVLKIARNNLPKGAKLIYNDYGEQYPEKRNAVLAIIKKIEEYEEKTGEIILDGIGLQTHYDTSVTPAQIRAIFSDFSATGKEIQITEADIMPGMTSPTKRMEYNPSDPQYELIWNELFECAKDYGIDVFVGWGTSDEINWRGGNISTMVGADDKIKPYIKKAIEGISDARKSGYEDASDATRTGLIKRFISAIRQDLNPEINTNERGNND